MKVFSSYTLGLLSLPIPLFCPSSLSLTYLTQDLPSPLHLLSSLLFPSLCNKVVQFLLSGLSVLSSFFCFIFFTTPVSPLSSSRLLPYLPIVLENSIAAVWLPPRYQGCNKHKHTFPTPSLLVDRHSKTIVRWHLPGVDIHTCCHNGFQFHQKHLQLHFRWALTTGLMAGVLMSQLR